MRARYYLVQSQVTDSFYVRGKRTLRRGGGGRLQNSNDGEILSSTKSSNGSFLSTSKENTEKRV